MAQPKRTLYEIVGVAPDAAADEVARACVEKRSELESRGSADTSTVALVRHACEVLTDPARRAAYDARIAQDAAPAVAETAPTTPVDAEDAPPEPRRAPWGIIALAGAAILIVVLFVARMMTNPVPPAPVAEAPKPVSAAPAKPPSPSQVLAAVTPSAAKLQSVDLSGTVQSLGLAVSTEPGMAVTTCHAIAANAQIVATGAGAKGAGTLVLTDEVLDLCKLSIAGLELKPLALSAEEVKPGTRAYVVSPDAPGGFALAEAAVTQRVKGAAGDAFQLSITAANGAPVLDEWGKLLGIATQGRVIPAAWIAEAKTRGR